MRILAIESSCDETAAAIVRDKYTVEASIVLSQAEMHAAYGGVVPEIASRKHIEVVAGLVDAVVKEAGMTSDALDAVAVTYAPGLIGALLCGVSFAKSYAYAKKLPLIPVHHLRGHIAGNYLAFPDLKPPFVCLLVSGGHTLVVKVESFTKMTCMATTRDDAAGEAFDKIARVLGLGYPGGPVIDKIAKEGDSTAYPLPTPKVDGAPLDFSFSGLKTAIINLIHNAKQKDIDIHVPDLAASFNTKVCTLLLDSALAVCKAEGLSTLCLAGGVAANSALREQAAARTASAGIKLYAPPLHLCGDNAAMIAAQAFYEFEAGNIAPLNLNAYATKDISLG